MRTASTASTSIWVSLHTADPGDAGTQATSEAAYTSYARVATDRTTVDWIVTAAQQRLTGGIHHVCHLHGVLDHGRSRHFSVGLSSSGAGTAIYNGTVTPNISVTTNVTPSLTTASAITED